MKRKVAAIVLVATLAMSTFVGCGSKDKKSTVKEDTTKTEVSVDDTKDVDETTEDTYEDGVFKNVEEAFADPTVSKELKAAYETMSNSSYSMDISAEGNCMIITATVKNVEYSDSLAEQMQAAVDATESTMVSQANSLQTMVEEEGVSIKTVYVTSDGTELASGTFYAEN